MPEPVRVPADLLQAERARRQQLRLVKGRGVENGALAARNAELRRLRREEGKSVAALAADFGLSQRAVQEVVYGAVS